METSARYTLVGIVVIVILTGVVWAGVWLLRGGEEEEAEFYAIYFKKQSLSGLQRDSAVTMKGIRVGTVRNVRILPSDIEIIRVEIGVQEGTPVKADTRAVIQRNLLTGFALIDLIGSTQNSPQLEGTVPGEEYPVIPEGQTQLAELQNTLPEVMNKVRLVLEDIARFTTPDNAKAVQGILKSIDTLSGQMANKEDAFSVALRDFSALSLELRNLSATAGQSLRFFNASTEKAVQSFIKLSQDISRQTQSVAQDVDALSNQFSGSIRRINEPRSILFGPGPAELGPGEKE